MDHKLRSRKTAIVPRSLFRASLVGASVVPFCATIGVTWLAPGCGDSAPPAGVACICFSDGGSSCPGAGCAGVAASCFTDPSLPFCSDAGDGGRRDGALPEGGDAEAASDSGDARDVLLLDAPDAKD